MQTWSTMNWAAMSHALFSLNLEIIFFVFDGFGNVAADVEGGGKTFLCCIGCGCLSIGTVIVVERSA